MEYSDIDRFMKAAGLADDPAFDDLNFLSEPIPPQGKRILLGLYFPEGDPNPPWGYLPPSTIILPPDSSVDTLLHELGHRYGDFYYNDISEEFAENYRKHHSREARSAARSIAQVLPKICIRCPGYLDLCPYCDYGGWGNWLTK